MSRIIVTLTDEKSFNMDIEVPTGVGFEKLFEDINQFVLTVHPELSGAVQYSDLFLPKFGRNMKSDETLDTAMVFNGDYIVIK